MDEFAGRPSFFFNCHNNLLEEVSKFRAARRLWAKIMKERFGAKNPRSMMLRFHTQTAGCSLTAQQPDNNIVRVTLQALAAVMGGTQSLHTNSRDEALCLPTQDSVQIALRTQQLIAHESGVAGSVDPLGGSYLVEELTDRMEEGIQGVIDELDDYGGVVAAIEDGYLQARIARRAKERKELIDSGERVVVGVNRYGDDRPPEIGEMFALDPESSIRTLEKLERLRAERDQSQVEQTLATLSAAAATDHENLMPLLVDCCHAEATVGEMVAVLKAEWGEFDEPIRF